MCASPGPSVCPSALIPLTLLLSSTSLPVGQIFSKTVVVGLGMGVRGVVREAAGVEAVFSEIILQGWLGQHFCLQSWKSNLQSACSSWVPHCIEVILLLLIPFPLVEGPPRHWLPCCEQTLALRSYDRETTPFSDHVKISLYSQGHSTWSKSSSKTVIFMPPETPRIRCK